MVAQRAELFGFLVLLAGLAGGGWLMWQVRQQQGRLLLRLETLEARVALREMRKQPRTVPMKIAYLILAHKNPVHLTRLISALQTEHAHIFLHIDKKSKGFTHLSDNSTITLIKKPVSVNWGGFSIVQATLQLMQEAHASGEYDYFILLSGADYPIRSNASLFQFLQQHDGEEFLNLCKMPEVNKPLERVEYFHFEDEGDFATSFLSKRVISRRVINRAVNKINTALRSAHFKRKYPKRYAHFTLYAGSQWWGLSKRCIDYVLQFVADNPEYVDFYKYTLIPDEMFFHTIIGNSPFKKHVVLAFMYTDWVTGSPATITEEHLPILSQHMLPSDYGGEMTPFFARKFSDKSQAIITDITHLLRNDDQQAEAKTTCYASGMSPYEV